MSAIVFSSIPNTAGDQPADEARQRRAGWLARVYGSHDRLSRIGRIAARLAALDPNFDDVRLADVGRPLFLADAQVREVLDRLLADGLVDLRPSIRVGAVRVKLML